MCGEIQYDGPAPYGGKVQGSIRLLCLYLDNWSTLSDHQTISLSHLIFKEIRGSPRGVLLEARGGGGGGGGLRKLDKNEQQQQKKERTE